MKLKIFTIVLILYTLVDFSRGYLCYECDSTTSSECYHVHPMSSTVVGVYCDTAGRGDQTCFYAHVSENKKRKMIRGCKERNYCDKLEAQEKNIYFKVLSCGECTEDLCNSSFKLHSVTSHTILIALAFTLRNTFNV